MANEFDREGLQKFVNEGEKSPPPFFVGRKKPIQDILNTARNVFRPDATKHGMAGATRILHGAPGAGKSSTLAELASRCRDQVTEDAPRILTLSSEDLDGNLSGTIADIAAAARTPADSWRKIVTEYENEIKGRLNEKISLFGFGFNPYRLILGSPPTNLKDLARSNPPKAWVAPVILAIDEAQRLTSKEDTPQAHVLQAIHDDKYGLPLMLVLAGLGDTPDRAQRVGLSRVIPRHELGCLSEEEVQRLMNGFCDHFGIRVSDQGNQLMELAKPAEGWPRHLHFTLQALGREVLTTDGDLVRISWDNAKDNSAEGRLLYYKAQRSRAMIHSAPLVASIMKKLDTRLETHEILNFMKKVTEANPGVELPDGMTFGSFYEHLLHQGALQEDNDNFVHCPIPSFRSHLISVGGGFSANAALPD